MRARLPPFPLELALLTVALGVARATSEFEFADVDPLGPRASSSSEPNQDPTQDPTPSLPPAALVRSAVHPVTNMRVDTFLKPLGNLTKGQVLNTRPWGAAGRLARPDPDGDDPILIARVAFDLVHGDTLEPLPLDRAYNHHLVIYSRPGPAAPRRVDSRGSAVLSPCGVGAFFAGGGAEWRGAQADDERRNRTERRAEEDDEVSPDAATSTRAFAPSLAPRSDASRPARSAPPPFAFAPLDVSNLWVEPAGTEWGANVHLIDLRGVASVRDTVQCNCASYGARTPGSPRDFDGSALPGGGIACCGDGALSPLAPGESADLAPVPVALRYDVTWTRATETDAAFASLPAGVRTAAAASPMTATLMVSSNPAMDGASCAGEYDARPCGAFDGTPDEEAAAWAAKLARESDAPRWPTDQTCDEPAADGSDAKVTVAYSHPFRLPPGAAYDATRMVGHLHVGGRNVRLLNVTGGVDPSEAPVVCESRPEYGDEPNVAGDEAGFLVRMTRCDFDPPARLRAGEAYVVRAEYGADRDEYAPAGFPPPYEGVMGYVTIAFTVPEGAKVAAFSASGKTPPEREIAAGTCVARDAAGSSGVRSANVSISSVGDPHGDPDHDHERDHEPPTDERDEIGSNASVSRLGASSAGASIAARPETPGPSPGPALDGSATLSPDGSFAMTWRHLPGNRVRFTLFADAPAWLSIGVHRPGGRGMPGADMVVAQSLDEGETWIVSEAWTSAYDRPRAKAFYGPATSGLDPNACAVEVGSDGRVAVTFTRDGSVDADENPTGATIERGAVAAVAWARGDPGVLAMDYHGARRGTVTVTW